MWALFLGERAWAVEQRSSVSWALNERRGRSKGVDKGLQKTDWSRVSDAVKGSCLVLG